MLDDLLIFFVNRNLARIEFVCLCNGISIRGYKGKKRGEGKKGTDPVRGSFVRPSRAY